MFGIPKINTIFLINYNNKSKPEQQTQLTRTHVTLEAMNTLDHQVIT